MRTLISLTGGLDSTHLLYKLLKETDDEVYAFYLDLRLTDGSTQEHKQYMEQVSSMKVAQWMNDNVRPLKYDIIEKDSFFRERYPMLEALYFAIPYINEGLYDRFWFALSAEDIGVFGVQIKNALQYRFDQYATRGALEFPLLEQNIGRAHHLQAIPSVLHPILADCSNIGPNHEKCGICKSCMRRKQDIERLSSGLTADECLKLRVELKQKFLNNYAIDARGLAAGWSDPELQIMGSFVPSELEENKEVKHIFFEPYERGKYENDW